MSWYSSWWWWSSSFPLHHDLGIPRITLANVKALAFWLLMDPLQNLLNKLIYLCLSVYEFGLYHFHKLMDSKEVARQSMCKNFGCRRQQDTSGNGSLTIFISSSPMSPDYLLLSLWPNGAVSQQTSGLSMSCMLAAMCARVEWPVTGGIPGHCESEGLPSRISHLLLCFPGP